MRKSKVMYGQQLAKRVFRGVDQQDAYIRAATWYGNNIVDSGKFNDVAVQYVKASGNSITMVLWATLDRQSVMDSHCECCRAMHRSFFINEDTNCNRCSTLGFHKRVEQKMSIKLEYYKEMLRSLISR